MTKKKLRLLSAFMTEQKSLYTNKSQMNRGGSPGSLLGYVDKKDTLKLIGCLSLEIKPFIINGLIEFGVLVFPFQLVLESMYEDYHQN